MRISFIALLLCLGLTLACNDSNPQESQDMTASDAPAAASPAPVKPQGLQPPYPIADSSQIQSIEGIELYIVEKGSGAVPKPGSTVVIEYHGYLTNGEVFDSSFNTDGPVAFPLGNLIRGWQIGLTKVPSGSKVKLIIPPDLAYGAQARPGIPANSTLVFDIELISTY